MSRTEAAPAAAPSNATVALSWLVRAGLAALFLTAALPKLADPAQLASDMVNYRVLPEGLVPPLALFVPVFEVILALALVLPAFAQGGAVLGALTLGVFGAAMAQAKLRGIDLDCGCFGAAARDQVSWFKVAQNLALATLAIWVAWATPRWSPGAQRREDRAP